MLAGSYSVTPRADYSVCTNCARECDSTCANNSIPWLTHSSSCVLCSHGADCKGCSGPGMRLWSAALPGRVVCWFPLPHLPHPALQPGIISPRMDRWEHGPARPYAMPAWVGACLNMRACSVQVGGVRHSLPVSNLFVLLPFFPLSPPFRPRASSVPLVTFRLEPAPRQLAHPGAESSYSRAGRWGRWHAYQLWIEPYYLHNRWVHCHSCHATPQPAHLVTTIASEVETHG